MPTSDSPPAPSLRVLATSVGRPALLGRADRDEVWSAIAKQPLGAAAVELSPINLAGDDQADRSVHGGPDKAVYVYPSEHWAWWREELGLEGGVGTFGENVTGAGLLEAAVHIGDRFAWGDAVVEVSQPRAPCYKLALHLGRNDVLKAMTRSARTGWYLRVIEPGIVPTSASMERIGHDPAAPSIEQVFTTTFARELDTGAARRILATTTLATDWADALARRLLRPG